MLQQHLLDYCQKEKTKQNKNKSARRGAQLVSIGIRSVCLQFEPNIINLLSKR